ncbi:hypothetical protein FQR65_LT14423 [Abscondita terminalis]|nr:hypothetical protein FQR65_LT14423 [Abscondita terminalis]
MHFIDFLVILESASILAFVNTSLPVLSVYYETFCPDSARFFRFQLNRTAVVLQDNVRVELVPYGFATHEMNNGVWHFVCQHGVQECLGNKIHACLLRQGFNQIQTIALVTCSLISTDPASLRELKMCADKMELELNSIEKCVLGVEGDLLLVRHGQTTHGVSPPINYLPSIIVNHNYDQDIQTVGEYNLLKALCSKNYIQDDACN